MARRIFQVIEAGFDRTAPDQALADGLEVYREFLVKKTQGVTVRIWVNP